MDEVKDLQLQIGALYERERKRVRQERLVIRRMKVDLIYPEYGDMLGFVLSRGHLPTYKALTVKQKDGLSAALGIGCGIETVYNRLRKVINNGRPK